jgi:hypothetical protein
MTLQNSQARRGWRSVATPAGAGLALIALLAGGCARESAETTANAYPTNAAGQTYGSAMDASSPGDEPDLIAVLATNGREGYALKEQFNQEGTQPSSPEEAVAVQSEHDRDQAEAFYGVLAEAFDLDADISDVDPVAAADVLFGAQVGLYDGSLNAETAGGLINQALDLVGVSAEQCDDGPECAQILTEAVGAAEEVLRVVIPVYESDGHTVIGEFWIG